MLFHEWRTEKVYYEAQWGEVSVLDDKTVNVGRDGLLRKIRTRKKRYTTASVH